MTRSFVIPLSMTDMPLYRHVIGSIRNVRAAARQAFAVVFATQVAGAEIIVDDDGNVSVKPSNARAKAILAAAIDRVEIVTDIELPSLRTRGGKPCPELAQAVLMRQARMPVYELREYVLEHLCPTINSFVWDDLRRRIWTRWQARDPEFPRAGMGWLALQNVRGLAAFRFSGIGFPTAVLRAEALAPHAVTLNWDRDIGPVEFNIGTIDPGRWHWWNRVVGGKTERGTFILNERDGKLNLSVSYEHPDTASEVDANRTMCVRMVENSIMLIGPDGERTLDWVYLSEAIGWAGQLKKQNDKWAARRAATGSPRKPWGEPRRFRGTAAHQNRFTRCRENGMHGRNHAWAKRIATRAMDWRCGVVKFEVPATATLNGHPWGWAHLRTVISYKLSAIAATMIVPDEPAVVL